MSEYTPTMQQIRDSYRSHDTLQAAAAGFSWEERGEEFDRWLSAHDEQVRADAKVEAWDEAKALIRATDSDDRLEHTMHGGVLTPEWDQQTKGMNAAIGVIDYLAAPYRVPAEQKESN